MLLLLLLLSTMIVCIHILSRRFSRCRQCSREYNTINSVKQCVCQTVGGMRATKIFVRSAASWPNPLDAMNSRTIRRNGLRCQLAETKRTRQHRAITIIIISLCNHSGFKNSKSHRQCLTVLFAWNVLIGLE